MLRFSALFCLFAVAGARGTRPLEQADGGTLLVDAYEREVIKERLRASGGHATAAARSLDLERSHLYQKCKQLGIDMREET